jgi:hypothetical protein
VTGLAPSLIFTRGSRYLYITGKHTVSRDTQFRAALLQYGPITLPVDQQIIRGVLDLAGKDASTAMTPLDRVFALPADALLSRRCLAAVLRTGLSRVPVWRKGPAGYPEFLGFLLTKEILQQVCTGSRCAVYGDQMRTCAIPITLLYGFALPGPRQCSTRSGLY